MRTDVKIGIAVGLLIVVAVITYYAIFGGGGADTENQGTKLAAGRAAPAPGGRETPGRSDANAVTLPRFEGIGGTPPAPRPGAEPNAAIVSPRLSREPEGAAAAPRLGAPPDDARVTPRLSEEPNTAVVSPRLAGGPRDVTVGPRIDESPRIGEGPRDVTVGPRIGEGPSDVTVGPRPPLGTEQIYIVQKGDSGFWAVAAKVYGDGRHWPLIQKANPNADTNHLQPGQKLKVPPKPAVRAAAGPPGGLIVTPGGQSIYIVKKGDAGFWGIAQSVYGNGKHWTVIAKANPKLNSTMLRPGTQLVIPPKPIRGSTPAAAPGPSVVPGPGEKIYVVKEGDAGFWGVSKAAYGNGMYWPLIAKANPSASSISLRPGQKLIVPELTEEARRSVGGATTRTGPPPRVEDVGLRPIFD